MALTQVDGGLLSPTNGQFYSMKNRIINGAMVIDQRYAGASVTPASSQYLVDRFAYTATQASKFTAQQNAGSVTPPAGFTNYLGMTVASAVSVAAGDTFLVSQNIEGYNIADLGWGTANAKTITLSFQVYSSLTGTFGGALTNSATARSYPFSYTVSSANTWTSVSITIVGDTSGTWLTTNGIGLVVRFGLGSGSTYSATSGAWATGNYVQPTSTVSVVGTNGATFYITGVQLEKGSTATSFDYRPYGTELALCQRYLPVVDGTGGGYYAGQCSSTSAGYIAFPFTVPARTNATGITLSAAASAYKVTNATALQVTVSGVAIVSTGLTSALCSFTGATGSPLVAGNATLMNLDGNKIFFTGCEL